MTGSLGWSIALGVSLGLGLWSLTVRLPRLSRPRLAARVAPYLLDISPEARRLVYRPAVDPLPVLGVALVPALKAFQTLFGSVLGAPGSTELRLRRAGDRRSIEAYRVRQMLWTVLGAVLGGGAAVLIGAAHGALSTAVALPLLGAAAGLLGADRLLAARARARMRRIESELPTVLEFLALSLSAGEGIHDALARVGRASGETAEEFRRVMAEVAVGVPLAVALARVADELRIPALTRCVAHLVAALDRGSPLAELLRAQAGDARDEARRALLESAGKKEIAMLVPLVFLILPITIAFAVFPGVLVLQSGL